MLPATILFSCLANAPAGVRPPPIDKACITASVRTPTGVTDPAKFLFVLFVGTPVGVTPPDGANEY